MPSSSSGALAWAWSDDRSTTTGCGSTTCLLGVPAASALMFARSFFEPRVFAGWLSRDGELVAALGWLATGLRSRCSRRGNRGCSTTVLSPELRRADRRRRARSCGAPGAGAATISGCSRSPGRRRSCSRRCALLANFALVRLELLDRQFDDPGDGVRGDASRAWRSPIASACCSVERDEAIEREIIAARLADTDPLTGLLNRRAFLRQAIGREGEQAADPADLDHFKRVNETIGHDGGDEVLRLFARIAAPAAPPGRAGRADGRRGVRHPVPADAPSRPTPCSTGCAPRGCRSTSVTASIGACTGPLTREADWKAMYRRADRALFDAKAAGRDRARDAAVQLTTIVGAR